MHFDARLCEISLTLPAKMGRHCHVLLLLSFFALVPSLRALNAPPTFTIDLGVEPRRRWDGAVKIVLERHPFDFSFGPTFESHNKTLFSKLSSQQYQSLAAALETHYPETAEELKGISSQFIAAGHFVSFEYLAAWVYFHELAHTPLADKDVYSRSCSVALAKDSDNNILHVGNMDQGPENVRNITLQIAFTRNGSTVFQGVDWYWITTGVTRCVRKGFVSLQENWREDGIESTQDVFNKIEVSQVSLHSYTPIVMSTGIHACVHIKYS